MTPARTETVTLDDFDRNRPTDAVLDAERAIVGTALDSARCTDLLAEILTPADFFDPELAAVFQSCVELSGSGQPVTPIAVHHHLTSTGQMALLSRSGPHLLPQLVSESLPPHADPLAHHAWIVADDSHRRNMLTAVTSARQFLGGPEFTRADTDLVLERIQRAALAGHRGETGPLWVRDDVDAILDSVENKDLAARITTPWRDINECVAPTPGQLIIAGARPGMGKSNFALNWAAHVALDLGEGVLFASMEMSRRELVLRLVAARAKVPLHKLEHNQMTADDWALVGRVLPDIHKAHLLVDESSDLTPARLRSRLRYMRTLAPTRLVVIDYLQLMRGTGKYERRDLEIADITRSLKLFAKSEGVCVVALCQLGRGPDLRADHQPVIADLRESGAIEQDADTVFLLYREDHYDHEKRAGEADFIIAKQRSGPKFTCTVAFQGHYARFVDMAES